MDEILISSERISTDYFEGWCWPRLITDSNETFLKTYLFLGASYLTDPVCKVREYLWELKISREASKLERVLISAKVFVCGYAALFTTIPGIALRTLASYFQKGAFIHLKGTLPEKTLQGKEISLYSRNVACIGAGYAITDGGVSPWTYRIEKIGKELLQQDGDTICLSEMYDISASLYLYEKLKGKYAHFYFNMGPKAMGPGAGLFVASKTPIQNPHFVPFPVATLQGRTKWACKGYFRFDLGEHARIYTTHLQHSEEPQFPNTNVIKISAEEALTVDCKDDVIARAAQMHLIVQDILKSPFKGAVILTGDLNFDDVEMEKGDWNFDQGTLHDEGHKTWGGDAFCVGLTGTKKSSVPLNLDHTLVWKNSAEKLETWLVDTTFDGNVFKKEAISDHSGLKSVVTL